MSPRIGECVRSTRETSITVRVNLDASDPMEIQTGIGMLDHLLDALSKHSRISMAIRCEGDLHIDDHHTVEDVAISLGTAIDIALDERRGIARFGYAYAPLDEALARAVIDLSGRPASVVELGMQREMLGTLSVENIPHFVSTLAVALRSSIHLDVLRGINDHHRAEAAFKALALALKQSVALADHADIPSTKGSL